MLRARPLGEADRIFTFLSTERGKIDAVGKGVRRAKSHLAGRLEFGNECELQMHRGRSLDVIVSADIVRSSWERLVEPERFAVAQLVAEFIDAFCEPDLAVPDVYALVDGMLRAVATHDDPRSLVPRFSLRLLSVLGLEPPVDACVRCGLAFEDDHAFVDAEMGGFICASCRERWRDLIELDADDLRNLADLAAARLSGRAAVRARPRVAHAVEQLIAHHLGRKPRTVLS